MPLPHPSGRHLCLPMCGHLVTQHCGSQRSGHDAPAVHLPHGWLCHPAKIHPPLGRLVSALLCPEMALVVAYLLLCSGHAYRGFCSCKVPEVSCASCTWSRFNCHVFCCPCVNFGACIDLLNIFHTYINTYRRRRFCQCVIMLLAASSTLLYVSAFWPCCSGSKAHLCDAAMPCRLYWMNPLNYATKAIIINEFTASKLQKNSPLHAVCKLAHGQNWLPGLATPCPSYLPEPDTEACLPA